MSIFHKSIIYYISYVTCGNQHIGFPIETELFISESNDV